MRNKFLTLALGAAMLSTSITAQETLTNKDGVEILPSAGDFAIGFNAVPLLNIIGNATAGNSKFAGFFDNNAILAKYMLEDKVALRAHFRIASTSMFDKNYVVDDASNDPRDLVLDYRTTNAQTFVLGGGYEMRKGDGRVQGFFGGDAALMYSQMTQRFDYGNSFGMVNQAPTSTTNWNTGSTGPEGQRTTFARSGGTFGFGLRPFAGVEYFIAPNVSLGAEFGWNIMFTNTADGSMTTEEFTPTSGEIFQRVTPMAGSRGLAMDTDDFNGIIYLMFYF